MAGAVPSFLEGYDPFGRLQAWKGKKSKYAVSRHWTISSYGAKFIVCRLEWNLEGQLAALSKMGFTAQEAVWLCLDEFDKLEEQYVS